MPPESLLAVDPENFRLLHLNWLHRKFFLELKLCSAHGPAFFITRKWKFFTQLVPDVPGLHVQRLPFENQ